jgi:hypothetical protein
MENKSSLESAKNYYANHCYTLRDVKELIRSKNIDDLALILNSNKHDIKLMFQCFKLFNLDEKEKRELDMYTREITHKIYLDVCERV